MRAPRPSALLDQQATSYKFKVQSSKSQAASCELRAARCRCAALNALLSGYPVLRACASLDLAPAIGYFDHALAKRLPAVARRLEQLGVCARAS